MVDLLTRDAHVGYPMMPFIGMHDRSRRDATIPFAPTLSWAPFSFPPPLPILPPFIFFSFFLSSPPLLLYFSLRSYYSPGGTWLSGARHEAAWLSEIENCGDGIAVSIPNYDHTLRCSFWFPDKTAITVMVI